MASSQSPGSDDSDAELDRRRLEAAGEAVSRRGSRDAAVDGSDGVYSPRFVAAVKDLVSLSSGGGACASDAKIALKVWAKCSDLYVVFCILGDATVGRVDS